MDKYLAFFSVNVPSDASLWDCVSVTGSESVYADLYDVDYYDKMEDGKSIVKLTVNAQSGLNPETVAENLVFDWEQDIVSDPVLKEFRKQD